MPLPQRLRTYCQYSSEPMRLNRVTVSDRVSRLFIRRDEYGCTRTCRNKKKMIQNEAQYTWGVCEHVTA